jgi:hypothetical protein
VFFRPGAGFLIPNLDVGNADLLDDADPVADGDGEVVGVHVLAEEMGVRPNRREKGRHLQRFARHVLAAFAVVEEAERPLDAVRGADVVADVVKVRQVRQLENVKPDGGEQHAQRELRSG